MDTTRYIGIDLHSDNFTAYCLSNDGKEIFCKKFSVENREMKQFCDLLLLTDKVAVEATINSTFFAEKIRPFISSFTVLSPSHFAIIGKSTKKTDKNDAKSIAIFLSKDLLPQARTRNNLSRYVSSLVDTRIIIVKTRSALINKTHAIMVRNGLKIRKNVLYRGDFSKHIYINELSHQTITELQFIEKKIIECNLSIRELELEIYRNAKNLRHFYTLLSVKGIGPLSASILAAIIEDVNDFPAANKLCSYFGIVPKVRHSNFSKQSARITKQGTKIGRSTLVQATWIAIRYHPFLKSHYERLAKKKGGRRAIVASSRKLLIIMYHAMKKDIIYTDFINNEYIDKKEWLKTIEPPLWPSNTPNSEKKALLP